MNKLTLFSMPLLAAAVPYIAFAQENLNDNLNRCVYGNCPYGGGYGGGYWGGMMGNMMGWGGMPYFGWFGGIIMVVFWILVILAVVYLIKYLVTGGGYDRRRYLEEKMLRAKRKEDSSIAILKERYARGEIDKKELQEKTKELKNL